jgi:hypothetical protein
MNSAHICTILGSILLLGSAMAAEQNGRKVNVVPVPPEIMNPPWLEARRAAQLKTAGDFESFIGFSFTDRIEESGIRFRNRVVADAGVTYKAVHYDHGNGIAVADVDGDGLYDIYFVNQVGANELWRNLGDGKFEDITDKAGLAVDDRISVTASFGDTDNDGDPDLYVTTVRKGNLLFENQGNGQFRDVSSNSGLNHKGHSSGAVLFDFDRDGLLDVFLTNVGQYTSELPRIANHEGIEYKFYVGFTDAFSGHRYPQRTEQSLLFRNIGNNRFEDVSSILLDTEFGWSGDASAIDVNEDGWPDIYELNMQGHDLYYENQQGESFELKSREVFPKTSWGAMGIKVFDWNNDGHMDIYITDMHSDMSQKVGPDQERVKSDVQWPEEHLMSGGNSIYGNTFFENRGDGSFAEISDRIGAENYWPWGLSVGDLNADGFQDVFVTASMNFPFRYQTNGLLINEQGKRFRNAEFILGVEPRKNGVTAQVWFRLDCDEDDKYTHQRCINRTGLGEIWAARGSRASVIFDLDNDGDLDVVTNEFNAEPMVLINDLAQVHDGLSFLKVKLVGNTSNRGGVGARVTVKAGDHSYIQVLDGKSGYLSQSLKPLYFGLAAMGQVDEIIVQWPSGTRQIVPGSKTNSLVEITESAN